MESGEITVELLIVVLWKPQLKQNLDSAGTFIGTSLALRSIFGTLVAQRIPLSGSAKTYPLVPNKNSFQVRNENPLLRSLTTPVPGTVLTTIPSSYG